MAAGGGWGQGLGWEPLKLDLSPSRGQLARNAHKKRAEYKTNKQKPNKAQNRNKQMPARRPALSAQTLPKLPPPVWVLLHVCWSFDRTEVSESHIEALQSLHHNPAEAKT